MKIFLLTLLILSFSSLQADIHDNAHQAQSKQAVILCKGNEHPAILKINRLKDEEILMIYNPKNILRRDDGSFSIAGTMIEYDFADGLVYHDYIHPLNGLNKPPHTLFNCMYSRGIVRNIQVELSCLQGSVVKEIVQRPKDYYKPKSISGCKANDFFMFSVKFIKN